MLNTMYKQRNMRQPRNNNGWRKRHNNNSRNNKNKFFGKKIDINRFISKAETNRKDQVFIPKNSFNDFAIHPNLKKTIKKRGFGKPMPIQDKIIPIILQGRDVIGLANTGTGKTAAFLIPIIHKFLSNNQEKALIIVPTRELAIQIREEFLELTKGINIFSVVIVGGARIGKQIRDLQRNHQVVIGTPGRLKDLISRKKLDLSSFNNVVLDEADRMLDMGFISDVKFLLSFVKKKRQTMLFSATLGREIERLVNNFLVNPEKISIQTKEVSKQIDQDIIRINNSRNKQEVLHDVLNNSGFEKALIFTRTKRGADKLSKGLHQRGFKSDAIHGDKAHNKRQRVLQMFKQNSINVLIATDVAARGLDIPNVSHVINFDVPATYEDYIHRIGRTGRAGKTGKALTFIN